MQDNFNLTKYLRHGNKLLNENIGGYVDLKPINELNDLGMTEEDKQDDMSLEELMGNAMEIEDEEEFIDGFEETKKEAQQAFIDTVNNLRQMSFEDDVIIDMFKSALASQDMEESFDADKSNALRAAKAKGMDTDNMQFMSAEEIWDAIEKKDTPIDTSKGNTGYEDDDSNRPYWA